MGKIGELKLKAESGVVSIPVFEAGDSGSSVYEFLRVETASGTGFVPLTSTKEAEYPFLKISSSANGVLAVHNNAVVNNNTTETLEKSFSGNHTSTFWEKSSAEIVSADLTITLYQPTRYFGVRTGFDRGNQENIELITKQNRNTGDNANVRWTYEDGLRYDSGGLGSNESKIDMVVKDNGSTMEITLRETGETITKSIDNFTRIYYDGDDSRHSAEINGTIEYTT